MISETLEQIVARTGLPMDRVMAVTHDMLHFGLVEHDIDARTYRVRESTSVPDASGWVTMTQIARELGCRASEAARRMRGYYDLGLVRAAWCRDVGPVFRVVQKGDPR